MKWVHRSTDTWPSVEKKVKTLDRAKNMDYLFFQKIRNLPWGKPDYFLQG
jgi:hypothetical protein